MSSIISGLGDLAGKSAGEALAFGLGFALGRALEPAGVGLAQTAWDTDPNKVLDPHDAAAIVAERLTDLGWGEKESRQTGIDADRFGRLVNEVMEAPGFGELLRMLRRGTITMDDFLHGLGKHKYETRWDGPLEELQTERLDPAVIAVSGQRGTMDDAGLLPVGPPTDVGRVPPMPVSPLDPIKEAAASGIDRERLAVMMRNVGLPPGPGELLQLLNRGAIEEPDFYRGVAEGNTRNEWGSFLIKLRRRLLTPHEYQEAALRGVLAQSEADAGSALSGMEQADAHLLFEILGRPLAVHQITTGLARGGSYGGTYDDVPEPYRDAIRRSNIRPEYAVLDHANRYTIPSYFILRAILQDGGMTSADFAQYGKELGWPPDLADKAAKAISGGATAKANTHVTKAQTQLWNAVHKSYVDDLTTEPLARAALTELGVTDTSQAEVLALWNHERAIVRKPLTPAQIKKAIGQPGKDKAWAMERLAEIGYDQSDAETFLAE